MDGHLAYSGMLSYQAWNTWKFELITYYDRAVESRHRIVSSRDFLLTGWQLRVGTVEVVHPTGRLRAGPGDWLLIPPGVARRHRFSTDAVIRSLRCVVVDATGQAPGIGSAPVRHSGGDVALNAAADRLAQVAHPDHVLQSLTLSPSAWAAMQTAVIDWCVLASERSGMQLGTVLREPRVAAAQRLLQSRRSPAAIPWNKLRSATGLSRPQLDRLFREHSGCTVRAWSENSLLADACSALRDVSEPVKAVADRLGFGDPSHFCRWFRQRVGASPADWRRSGAT